MRDIPTIWVMEKSILIVEDNTEALDLLEMYFELRGFRVMRAQDGVAGWESIQNQPPSVALSDYLMPRMDGVTLCEKIRSTSDYAHIPFILMTGTPHLPNSSLPDAMFLKPLKLDQLTELIEDAIERFSNNREAKSPTPKYRAG